MSRKPKARVAPGHQITPGFAVALLGRDDDPRLKWNVPRGEILRAVETVGGLAALAKVDRTTVYRAGIAPGSVQALQWVRDRRLRMGRPLVELTAVVSDEDAQRRFLRARYPRFLEVMDRIEESKHARPKLVAVHDSSLKKTPGRSRAVHYSDEVREITEEERHLFDQTEGRGLLMQRAHKSGISVKALCGLLGLSRMGFWKWRKTLPFALREQLTSALRR